MYNDLRIRKTSVDISITVFRKCPARVSITINFSKHRLFSLACFDLNMMPLVKHVIVVLNIVFLNLFGELEN